MNNIRKALIIGTIILVGIMHIGCEKKQETIEQTQTDTKVMEAEQELDQAPDKTKLRIITQFGNSDHMGNTYKKILEKFQKENPKIMIKDESEIVNQQWKAKIIADFIADNEPDIIFTFIGTDTKPIIEREKLVSIEEIRKEYPNYATNIAEDILELGRELNGNTYAVPVVGFYEALFVNEKIFNELELELPTDWEKFETAIHMLQDNEKVPIAAALGEKPHYWIEHIILSQGGSKVYNNHDITAVKNEWIAALSHLRGLYEMGAFPRDTNSISDDMAIDLFNNQGAAMLLNTNLAVKDIQNPEDIVVLPFPTVPGGSKESDEIISSFPAGWYITKKAWEDLTKREAVVQFIETMTSSDAIEEFGREGGIPATGDVKESDLILRTSTKKRPIESWIEKDVWNQLVEKISDITMH